MAREIGHFAHGELGIERRELDYRRASRPLWVGYLSLFLWSVAGFVLSYLGLMRKEKE